MIAVFDMGGVLIRNHNVFPALSAELGFGGFSSFADFGSDVRAALRLYSEGRIEEKDFWKSFSDITGRKVELDGGSLFGSFFDPYIDEPTLSVIKELKDRGCRVVCGTNVIKEHYDVHIQRHQYDVFDKVYPSYTMHIDKPDPSFYRYILSEEGIAPNEVFFTDDSAENVASAASLGIHAYVYQGADKLRSDLMKENLL